MNSPIVLISREELKALVKEALEEALKSSPPKKHLTDSKGSVVDDNLAYGLRGVCDLFQVSSATACTYVKTFLAPIVLRHGKKIIIRKDEALRAFAQHKERSGKPA